MTERVRRLRELSLEAKPCISVERARLMTEFYRNNKDRYSAPVLRALAFKHLCEKKTIYIGPDELIVGERGPFPKATPTYPELTCHSVDDFRILDSREKTSYEVSPESVEAYESEIIPFWKGLSLRDQIFELLPVDWKDAYDAGIFTEFMEQRAPGHTVADGKIYRKGLLDLKVEIAIAMKKLNSGRGAWDQDEAGEKNYSPGSGTGDGGSANTGEGASDPRRFSTRHKLEQLRAMEIAADGLMAFAARHAALAGEMASNEKAPGRKQNLELIAKTCAHVPARAPRTFHEALQMYWFCHLAVITELNGWDAFSPGHLDQHLEPFFKRDVEAGILDRDRAKELLECFFIKFNNHPAPPKVGVTAAESGTYTDFANINIAGLKRDGSDGSNEVSFLLLEVIDEMHLVQPSTNVQISRKTPDLFLKEACRVIRKGYGFPSVFNSDVVVEELIRQGKSAEDAREGGTSGCVETGAFGKEAYILTGYFNLPKVLELALWDGVDRRTGKQLGLRTGSAADFGTFGELYETFEKQMRHFLEINSGATTSLRRPTVRPCQLRFCHSLPMTA